MVLGVSRAFEPLSRLKTKIGHFRGTTLQVLGVKTSPARRFYPRGARKPDEMTKAGQAPAKNTLKSQKKKSCPTSYRQYSTSFVKTNAPGGFPSSGTAVLTEFSKKHPCKSLLAAVKGPTFDQKGPTFRLCHGTQRQN